MAYIDTEECLINLDKVRFIEKLEDDLKVIIHFHGVEESEKNSDTIELEFEHQYQYDEFLSDVFHKV